MNSPIETSRSLNSKEGPANPLESCIAIAFAEILGHESVGIDEDFFDLGGDSMGAMELSIKLSELVTKEAFFRVFVETATVRALAASASRNVGMNAQFVPIQTFGSRAPIVFIHAIGGTVFFYHQLSHRLGRDQPFYAVQSFGFGKDEPPLSSVKEMANRYRELIRPIASKGPLWLGGYSFGCLIAAELAASFDDHGDSLAGLLLIAPPAPSQGASVAPSAIETRAQELLEAFLRRERVDGSVANMLLTIYRAHLTAEVEHHCRPWKAPTSLFLGRDDPWSLTSLENWRPLARGGINTQIVSGSHVSMMLAPDVDELATGIRISIDSASRPSSQ